MLGDTGEYEPKTLAADCVDDLVLHGIRYIKAHGERVEVRSGAALQAYGVNYVLLDSRQRIHSLRYPEALRYFCCELLAYFKGSLNVNEGLAQASSYWRKLADKSGTVQSNYGYYIFRQKVNEFTQYDWVLNNLRRNPKSRRALCNINQPMHKDLNSKDFPCTIAVQFLVRGNQLCCEVFSRSEDVVTGLPYDIGFFSFVNELVCADLNRYMRDPIKLGYTMVRCSFTQIYDRTAWKAELALGESTNKATLPTLMPAIEDPEKTLEDIYNGTKQTEVIRWVFDNAG